VLITLDVQLVSWRNLCHEDETGIPIYRKTVTLEIEGSIGPVDKNIRKVGAGSRKGQRPSLGSNWLWRFGRETSAHTR
jgi:hypothetical protein